MKSNFWYNPRRTHHPTSQQPQCSADGVNQEALEMQVLSTTPALLRQKLGRWGPESALTRPLAIVMPVQVSRTSEKPLPLSIRERGMLGSPESRAAECWPWAAVGWDEHPSCGCPPPHCFSSDPSLHNLQIRAPSAHHLVDAGATSAKNDTNKSPYPQWSSRFSGESKFGSITEKFPDFRQIEEAQGCGCGGLWP